MAQEGKFMEGQFPDKSPEVPKGKKVIWYQPYTRKNKAGKLIIIRGHFKRFA